MLLSSDHQFLLIFKTCFSHQSACRKQGRVRVRASGQAWRRRRWEEAALGSQSSSSSTTTSFIIIIIIHHHQQHQRWEAALPLLRWRLPPLDLLSLCLTGEESFPFGLFWYFWPEFCVTCGESIFLWPFLWFLTRTFHFSPSPLVQLAETPDVVVVSKDWSMKQLFQSFLLFLLCKSCLGSIALISHFLIQWWLVLLMIGLLVILTDTVWFWGRRK